MHSPRAIGPIRSLVAVIAVAVAVSLAQLADLVTFRAMVATYGLAAEANPIAAGAAETFGVDAVSVAKIALVGLVIVVYGLLLGSYGRAGSLVATLAVVAGFIGAVSNTLVLTA